MMAPESKDNLQLEIGHVLFLDIVGYSKLMIDEQRERLHRLTKIVLKTSQVEKSTDEQLVKLPTGDGMALVFRHSSEEPARCALEVARALQQYPEIGVRMGVHSGPVSEVTDVSGRTNLAGPGINIAQRVMDCGDAGHILVSQRVAEDLIAYRHWSQQLHALGEFEVKHGVRLQIFNLYDDHAGNPALPAKLKVNSKKKRSYGLAVAIAFIATCLLGVILYALLQKRDNVHVSGTDTERHPIRSLAVLPLDNYSGDPKEDYFAEGMTDELTTHLANISQLRVISRSSTMQLKGKDRPATPEIAKILNVDAVVEGSVQRQGDKVRINAQLIDARADQHLWAKSFERDSRDVFALQDELASAIAGEINVRLTPREQARLTNAPTVNPAAYDAYLQGRYFFNRPSDENLRKAITQFEEAIALDLNFAPAYSGLSDAYLWAAFNEGIITAAAARPRTKAAAEKALQLNDTAAEAHTSLGAYLAWYDHDWAASDREFRRAIELNSNYAFAHDQFSLSLACQGRLEEAVAEGRRAVELDPLNPAISTDLTLALGFQGKFKLARAELKQAMQLDPTFFFPHAQLGWLDLQEGNARAGIPEMEKAVAMGAPPFVTAYLGYAYGASGDRARALATIEELKKKGVGGFVPPYNLAIVHLGLGEHAHALDYLEQAQATDSQWMMYLGQDRIFDPLRANPRFIALLKKEHFDKNRLNPTHGKSSQ